MTDAVLYRLSSPDFANALKAACQEDGEHDELATLLADAQRLQTKLDELEDAWTSQAEGLDLKTMLRMRAAIEEELRATNNKMARLSSGKMLTTVLAGNVHEAWAKADLLQRRALMSLAGVEKIIVLPQGRGAVRRWTHERTGQSWQFNPDNIQLSFKF